MYCVLRGELILVCEELGCWHLRQCGKEALHYVSEVHVLASFSALSCHLRAAGPADRLKELLQEDRSALMASQALNQHAR